MQSGSELNLATWGMTDFQAADVVGFACMNGVNIHLLQPDTELILVHGAPVELGFKVTPPADCKNPDAFLDMWVRECKHITLGIELLTTEGASIHIGTSSIQTCSTYEFDLNEKKIAFNRSDPTTLYMSKVIVVQVDSAYTDVDIKLAMSAGVKAVQSKIPSVARGGMEPEEQVIRAFLETGRYCPPRVMPRHSTVAVRIVNVVSIMPWSRSLSMWTHVLGVTVSNTHPYKMLKLDDLSVVLDDTLLHEGLSLSRPVISEAYDFCSLNDVPFPIEIGPSGSYSFAFQLKAKFIGGNSSGGESDGLVNQVEATSALASGLSGISASPFVFSTPVKFKWSCKRNDTVSMMQPLKFKSLYEDILKQYLITSIDYLRWSACIPVRAGDPIEAELAALSAGSESEGIDACALDSFLVDISGPRSAKALTSFTVTIRVTNRTRGERSIVLKIDSGIVNVDLTEPVR